MQNRARSKFSPQFANHKQIMGTQFPSSCQQLATQFVLAGIAFPPRDPKGGPSTKATSSTRGGKTQEAKQEMEMMTRNPVREHNQCKKPANRQGNGTKAVGSHWGNLEEENLQRFLATERRKKKHGQIMSGVGGAEVDTGVVLYSNTVERRTLTNSSTHERAQKVALHTLSAVT